MKTKSKFFALLAVFLMLFTAFDFLCPPTVPELKPPIDSSTDYISITLEWYPSTDEHEITYHIQVATNESFDAGTIKVDQSGISRTSYWVSGLDSATTYYWRVRAFCMCGGYSDWSEVGWFTTGNW